MRKTTFQMDLEKPALPVVVALLVEASAGKGFLIVLLRKNLVKVADLYHSLRDNWIVTTRTETGLTMIPKISKHSARTVIGLYMPRKQKGAGSRPPQYSYCCLSLCNPKCNTNQLGRGADLAIRWCRAERWVATTRYNASIWTPFQF